MSVYDAIITLLDKAHVPFESIEHDPVESCEDSLAHRNAAGWSGASSKCILFHAKERFYLVVTTADRMIKARNFKKPFGTKNIRFATPEEALEQTGCRIGSMPPFGFENAELPIFVDRAIFNHIEFMFNPADPTKSFKIITPHLAVVYEYVAKSRGLVCGQRGGQIRFHRARIRLSRARDERERPPIWLLKKHFPEAVQKM